jgi:hypothetical protein
MKMEMLISTRVTSSLLGFGKKIFNQIIRRAFNEMGDGINHDFIALQEINLKEFIY